MADFFKSPGQPRIRMRSFISEPTNRGARYCADRHRLARFPLRFASQTLPRTALEPAFAHIRKCRQTLPYAILQALRGLCTKMCTTNGANYGQVAPAAFPTKSKTR